MSYAQQSDLQNVGFPVQAFGTLTSTQINAILQSASDQADSYFRARWGSAAVPLVVWDTAVTEAVAKIAAFRCAMVRGFNPLNPGDSALKMGHDAAISWLRDVQRQQAHPNVTLAATGQPGSTQANVTSYSVVNLFNGATAPNRGW